jgi:hypothetical protein
MAVLVPDPTMRAHLQFGKIIPVQASLVTTGQALVAVGIYMVVKGFKPAPVTATSA